MRVFTACVPPSTISFMMPFENRRFITARSSTRWAGRTISPWFIGTPPISWDEYSANSSWASKASISPNWPSSCSRSAQPATWFISSA